MKLLLVQPFGDNGAYELNEVYGQVNFILEDYNELFELVVFPEVKKKTLNKH